MELDFYEVKVTLTEPGLGTQSQRDVASEFLAPKGPDEGKDVSDEAETLQESLKKGTTVFHRYELKPGDLPPPEGFNKFGHRLTWDYVVRGFLKQAGEDLNGKIGGVKALKSKVTKYAYVFPRQVFMLVPDTAMQELIDSEGSLIAEWGARVTVERASQGTPLPYLERPLRAATMQGPRVALARSEMVPAGTMFYFRLEVIRTPEIKEALIRELLKYGGFSGFFQWRNGSYGRFKFEMEKIGEGDTPGDSMKIALPPLFWHPKLSRGDA